MGTLYLLLKELSYDNAAQIGLVMDRNRALNIIKQLTEREKEILDQLLLHRSLKAIACDLGITPSAVYQRLKSARKKLNASDRHDAARQYRLALLATDLVDKARTSGQDNYNGVALRESDANPVIAPSVLDALFERLDGQTIPDLLDKRFGRTWRIAGVLILSALMAIFAVLMTTIIRLVV